MTEAKFNWSIIGLVKDPYKNGYADVVREVKYRCTAEKGDETIYVDFACELPVPNLNSNFIDFSQLADQQLLDWCWQIKSSKQSIEQQMLKQFLLS